jgi:hypothetical protein
VSVVESWWYLVSWMMNLQDIQNNFGFRDMGVQCLGCNTVHFGNLLPTFWEQQVPLKRVTQLPLKLK